MRLAGQAVDRGNIDKENTNSKTGTNTKKKTKKTLSVMARDREHHM